MIDMNWIEIDAAAKNGKRQLVRNGDDFAAAYWTGDFWAYPLDHRGQAIEQIDFEPTHYSPKE